MSLVDDARRLASRIPCDVAGRGICVFCLHDDRTEEPHDEVHKSDCPWLSLPRIAAAMEAAERVAEIEPGVNLWSHSGQDYWCYACEALLSSWDGKGEEPHKQDCPQQALVAALRDDPS